MFGLYANQFAFTEAGNYTECYLILPATLAGLFAVIAFQKESPPAMLASGAMAAAAMMFKPVGLAPALAVAATLAIERLFGWLRARPKRRSAFQADSPSPPPRRSLPLFLWLIAGILVGLAPWLLWAWSRGLLHEMLDASILYNFSYVKNSAAGWAGQAARVPALFLRMIPICLGIGWLALSLWRSKNRNHASDHPSPSPLALFALLWFAFDLLGALAGGYAYGHYFLACIPSATFAGFLGLEFEWRRDAAPEIRRTAILFLIVSTLGLLALQIRHVAIAHERASRYADEDADLELKLRSLAPPGAPVLVWGHYFAPHARYGHSIPNRTLSVMHLAKSPRAAGWLGDELEAMFEKSPPELIVEPLFAWDDFPPLDESQSVGKRIGWPEQTAVAQSARRWIPELYDRPIRFEQGALRVNVYRRL